MTENSLLLPAPGRAKKLPFFNVKSVGGKPFRYLNRSNPFVDFWMDLAGCASLVIRLSSILIKFKTVAGFLRCFTPNNLYTPSESGDGCWFDDNERDILVFWKW